jgi:hypothetical protein
MRAMRAMRGITGNKKSSPSKKSRSCIRKAEQEKYRTRRKKKS